MAAGRFHLTWLRQASRGSSEKLKSRTHLYECLDCGRQISITAGTAMHRSKLPLTVWFWADHASRRPGPAIASLALGLVPSCVFAATMLAVFGLGAKATVGRQPESRRDRQCLNRLPFMQASFGNLFDAAQAIGAKKLSPASSIRPM
jgi:hypothetical protein